MFTAAFEMEYVVHFGLNTSIHGKSPFHESIVLLCREALQFFPTASQPRCHVHYHTSLAQLRQ